jgi:hypothetical protein
MADKIVTDKVAEAGQQAAGKSAEHSLFDKKGAIGKQFQGTTYRRLSIAQ